MTDKEAMAVALEALEIGWSPTYPNEVDAREKGMQAIAALKERLAQPHETTLKEFNQLIHDDPKYHIWAKEKALQTLHNENERLGLYRDAYAEPMAHDPLPRACNLAGVDYQTFLKIKAYMPVYDTTPPKGNT